MKRRPATALELLAAEPGLGAKGPVGLRVDELVHPVAAGHRRPLRRMERRGFRCVILTRLRPCPFFLVVFTCVR